MSNQTASPFHGGITERRPDGGDEGSYGREQRGVHEGDQADLVRNGDAPAQALQVQLAVIQPKGFRALAPWAGSFSEGRVPPLLGKSDSAILWALCASAVHQRNSDGPRVKEREPLGSNETSGKGARRATEVRGER
jgi:hypothetical protein